MTLESLNFQIITPEYDDNTDPELIRLRAELMAIKPLLDDALKRESLKDAEPLYAKALEAKAKLEAYKESLKNKEKGNYTYEQYFSDLHPFLLEIYKDKWGYTQEQLKTVKDVTSNSDNIHIGKYISFAVLREINKDENKKLLNKSKAGEIFLDSEIIDYENKKVFIPEIPEEIKLLGSSSILEYVHNTYKNKYILPDIKYIQYLSQLCDHVQKETNKTKKQALFKKIPREIQYGNWYYLPGSVFLNQEGEWVVPIVRWTGDIHTYDASFSLMRSKLGVGWGVGSYIVLLEK